MKPKYQRFAVKFSAVVLLSACGSPNGDTTKTNDAESASAVILRAPPSSSSSVAELIDSLRLISGVFTRGGSRAWEFSGDHALFSRLAQLGDSSVIALVECLDDARPAKATVEGRQVSVGVMCYAALQRMAYSMEHEDADLTWPGAVEPTASTEQLKAAKAAWKEVLRKGAYRIA